MEALNIKMNFRRFALPALDVMSLVVAYFVSVYIFAPVLDAASFTAHLVSHTPYLGILVIVWLAAAAERGLWNIRQREGIAAYLSALTKAVGDSTVFCVFVMALFTRDGLEREFLVTLCLTSLTSLLFARGMVRLVLKQLWQSGMGLRTSVIIGANDRAFRLVEAIQSREKYGYQVVGLLENEAGRQSALKGVDVPYLGTIDALPTILKERKVDDVFVALPVRSQYEVVEQITRQCEKAAVPIHFIADLLPVRVATRRLMHLEDIPLLSLSAIPEDRERLAMKRLIDFMVSSALLIVLLPVFLLIAILIKLGSKGPVFFSQERVGQNQRRFKMLKFRSMVADAEVLRDSLDELNEADGPVFKMRNDPRITLFGRYLRRFSVDEFPQLLNVWLAQMSLVGPRPPLPREVEGYSWDQRRRLSVKPGMTGLWQVSGRSDVSFEEWVDLDLKYIDNWSLANDFVILLKTFKAVITHRGAA